MSPSADIPCFDRPGGVYHQSHEGLSPHTPSTASSSRHSALESRLDPCSSASVSSSVDDEAPASTAGLSESGKEKLFRSTPKIEK
ncbi:hypothetical protein TNCT_698641 [Trichonephila clavata]|uniref:Uncharacterized protein n=1 Tax=Trichonephila clavata TaxID=2740835 RepID=A0A8X6LKL1_TRICU|nr:hypothetical protein TNCT_698641 [Trichonephila clavata]